MEGVLFFLAAIGALGGAIGIVAMRNPFYSVLALIVHLFSLAVLFLLLSAAFVAAAQVVVYAGAVMVLYVFVVAYVGGGEESAWEPIPGQRLLAPLLGIALFVELAIAVLASSLLALGSDGPDVKAGFGDPSAIGYLLLEKFLLPFEASSILLLLAAVGAIVLASKRDAGDDSPGSRSRGVPGESSPASGPSPEGTSELEAVPGEAPGTGSPGTPRVSGPGDPVPGAHPATSAQGVAAAK
ncbi:MAG TPA: NADH-quinone oxidoreductase subunit J [Solirubrobacterales bacterium]|nr:NADH-quinone oxidoreductase subunit J [Solirubrobacterales bacterium]